MAVTFEYKPPTVDAGLAVHAACSVAEQAAADHILAASQPLVPVDTGDLRDSGHTERMDTGVAVIYDAVATDDYAYGIKQHEDETLHHPNGGEAGFLRKPMHTEAGAVAALAAAELRRVLG